MVCEIILTNWGFNMILAFEELGNTFRQNLIEKDHEYATIYVHVNFQRVITGTQTKINSIEMNKIYVMQQ